MTRIIFFLVLVAVIALAGAWLAERPGDVTILWLGHEIKTSLMVAVAVFAISVIAVMLLWATLRLLFRWPRIAAQLRRERLKRRGQQAVSRGLLAVASGDVRAAKKYANEADRFAADEGLTLLLRAQNAQLLGDRPRADEAFRAMAEHDETRLLGLRGLYVEAQRRGDTAAGLQFAEQAARQAPALTWAGQAVLQARCAAGDWQGALQALDTRQRGGQIDKPTAKRQRAVLLTARAQQVQESDRTLARSTVSEALKLAPDLVPAVALAARLDAETGNARKAGKIIEAAWRTNPHPDLAELYAHARPGDAARERLRRIQNLLRINSAGREGAFALARAAIDAQDFSTARQALDPLRTAPSQRYALLMAELEDAEHANAGKAREWMARAVRAPRDPSWTADGIVSERWLPVSPVTGQIDAFVWRAPAEEIGFSEEPTVAADAPPVPIAIAEPVTAAEIVPEPASAPAPLPVAPPAAATMEPTMIEPAAAKVPATTPLAVAAAPVPAPPRPRAPDLVIPVIHAPDDPGPDINSDPKPDTSPRFPAGLT